MFLRIRRGRHVHGRCYRRTRPAPFHLQARAAPSGSASSARSNRSGDRPLPAPGASDLPSPGDRPMPAAGAPRTGRPGLRARADRPGLRPQQRPGPGATRGARPTTMSSKTTTTTPTRVDDDPERAYLAHVTRARRPRSASTPTTWSLRGRPTCHLVRQPDRPRWPSVPADELMPTTHPVSPTDALDLPPRRDRASRAACRGAATPRSSSTSATGGPTGSTSRARRTALWDFEPGLHRREVAAYRLSEAWASTSCHPRCCATARSARARCNGSSTPIIVSTTSRSTRSARTCTTAPRCRRPRRRRQQHRSQEWALSARRRSRLGHRPRTVLRRRLQAAHGDLGVRRRGLTPRTCCALDGSPEFRPSSLSCSTTTRSLPMQRRADWLAEHGVLPVDQSAAATRGRGVNRVTDDHASSTTTCSTDHPPRRPRQPRPPGRRCCASRATGPACAHLRDRARRRRHRPPAVAGGDAGRVSAGTARAGRWAAGVLDEGSGRSRSGR